MCVCDVIEMKQQIVEARCKIKIYIHKLLTYHSYFQKDILHRFKKISYTLFVGNEKICLIVYIYISLCKFVLHKNCNLVY